MLTIEQTYNVIKGLANMYQFDAYSDEEDDRIIIPEVIPFDAFKEHILDGDDGIILFDGEHVSVTYELYSKSDRVVLNILECKFEQTDELMSLRISLFPYRY